MGPMNADCPVGVVAKLGAAKTTMAIMVRTVGNAQIMRPLIVV